MQEVSLLVPGVRCGLGASTTNLAYASTLTVSVLEGAQLRSVLTGHSRALVGLTLAGDRLVTIGSDNKAKLWSVQGGLNAGCSETSLQAQPLQAEFLGTDDGDIAILLKTGNVVTWDGKSAPVKVPALVTHKGTVLRSSNSTLAVGQADGSILLWEFGAESTNILSFPDEDEVAVKDLQWNASGTQLLVTYDNDSIVTLAVETNEVVNRFSDENVTSIASSAWVSASGEGADENTFLTVDGVSNTLVMWNTGRKTAIKTFTLQEKIGTGVTQLIGVPTGKASFLLAFSDGAVGVYDIERQRLEFSTSSGHTETIFDAAFKPDNPQILATASYDGTAKIWNIETSECLQTLRDDGAVYAVSWSSAPETAHQLVTSGDNGQTTIWDTNTGEVIRRNDSHMKPSYRVRWNPVDNTKILSSSSDSTAVVTDTDGNILHRSSHPEAVYGVAWNPNKASVFATGCHDGAVRVWDMDSSTSAAINVYKGHSARVFNVEWSPLLRDVLASGSDDRTVRVWGTNSDKVLTGHSTNVRGVSWNSEVAYILVSGSWDGEIRVWDIRTSECLSTVAAHSADVYALASHPARPFSYVSASRDAFLRFWTLDSLLIAKIKLQVTLEGGRFRSTALGDTKKAMNPQAAALLCGKISQDIAAASADVKGQDQDSEAALLALYDRAFSFFGGGPGLYEFFQLLSSNVHEKSADKASTKQHVNDLRNTLLGEAQALRAAATDKQGEERVVMLSKAADLLLQMGELKQYCDVAVELGLWERAIALAPSVSLPFWKSLSERYAKILAEKLNADTLPFLTALGDHKSLIAFHNSRQQVDKAIVTAVAESSQRLPVAPDFGDDEGAEQNSKESEDDQREDVYITPQIRELVEARADAYFEQALPLLAAACHLQINDPIRAAQRLMLGDEVHAAYVLSSVLKLPNVDYICERMSIECERLGLWEEALTALQTMQSPERALSLLAARCDKSAPEKADYYAKAGLPSQELYLEDAEKALKEGKKADHVFYLVMAGSYDRAVTAGLEELKKELSKPYWSLSTLNLYMEPLNSLDMGKLSVETRAEILMYSYFVGAQTAIAKGFAPLVTFMFDAVRNLAEENKLPLPIPSAAMRLQEIHFMHVVNPTAALNMIRELANDSSIGKMKPLVLNTKKTFEAAALVSTEPSFKPRNITIPSASFVPRSTRDTITTSFISKTVINGTPFTLADEKTSISKSEYAMLIQCTPFSPLLTGKRV